MYTKENSDVLAFILVAMVALVILAIPMIWAVNVYEYYAIKNGISKKDTDKENIIYITNEAALDEGFEEV